jgi:dTDP-4-dehydrorhamnose 3,5-epimerase
MIFTETKLEGAFIIEPQKLEDARGFFARTWSQREFAERGLESRPVEGNASFNKAKGTLRGMHYQVAPFAQAKLVRCSRGAIYDVIVDLRPASPTFKQWVGVELTESNGLLLYVPAGFAHGFQTLEDETEIVYQMFEVYAPEHAGGVRWNDPAFDIRWPDAERVITKRDQNYADFQ